MDYRLRSVFFYSIFIILFTLYSACSSKQESVSDVHRFIYSSEVTERYQNKIIKHADSLLHLSALSLYRNLHHSFAGEPGTYVSMACYWWPDPASESGLPYIRIDGAVNPETRSAASHLPLLIDMAKRVEKLSFAYHITGDEQYAEKALEQQFVWFIDEESAMQPHLQHAQIVKGRNVGRSYGIIDGWWLVRVAESLEHLALSEHWDEELSNGLTSWFSDFFSWLIHSEFGKTEKRSNNNHGSWYDVQVVTYAMITGRKNFAKDYLQSISKKRLRNQFSPSGRQKFEMRRTRPLHYSIYNLAAQIKLAEMSVSLGLDYGNQRSFFSSGIENGVLYLIGALNKKDVTELSDPHDQTDIDALYAFILYTSDHLFGNDRIRIEKIRYLNEQKFLNPPLIQ